MRRGSNLSDGEFRIMECIWDSETEMTQALVMKTVNSTLDKKLNVSTFATYLRRMIRKGYLKKIDKGDGHPIYCPAITRQQYFENNAQQFNGKWITNPFMRMAMGCLTRQSAEERSEFADLIDNGDDE